MTKARGLQNVKFWRGEILQNIINLDGLLSLFLANKQQHQFPQFYKFSETRKLAPNSTQAQISEFWRENDFFSYSHESWGGFHGPKLLAQRSWFGIPKIIFGVAEWSTKKT